MPTKFLINPMAGTQGGPRFVQALRAACARLGYAEEQDYSLEWTRPGETTEQARRAGAIWDRVIAVGGDGTVRQVAEGLLKSGTGTALGVIPQGTGNDFSRAIGLYELWCRRHVIGIERVVEWLMTAPLSPVDVLAANDHLFFLSYCSLGFDARVSCAYECMRRRPKLGALLRGRVINECAYALLALRYIRARLPQLRIQMDIAEEGWTESRLRDGTCALIVSNVPCYAGGAHLVSGARYDDGQFEVTPIPHVWLFPLLIASRLWPRLRQACRLESWRVRRVGFHLPRGCAVQVDGEDCSASLATCPELSIRVVGQIPVVRGFADSRATHRVAPTHLSGGY